MPSVHLRILTVIMFLLIVCFCFFCLFPTNANAPSSISINETGLKISRQVKATHEKTIRPGQPQVEEKNSIPVQSSVPSTGQSVAVTEDEPAKVNQGNPADTTKPDQSLISQTTIAPPANPKSEATDQLIKRVDDINNMVALTFDDGPFPQMTAQYLAVLDRLNVRATFFMVGQRIKDYPELARKVVQYGSEIGSHSWGHARLDQLTAEAIAEDLRLVENQVQTNLSREISLLRPPYGGRNDNVLAVAKQLGYKVIIWDVDPRDWEDPPPEKIVAGVLEQVKPGSIIIMHEGHPNTLKALPVIIQRLRERGLEPVPVSEMLNQVKTPLGKPLASLPFDITLI